MNSYQTALKGQTEAYEAAQAALLAQQTEMDRLYAALAREIEQRAAQQRLDAAQRAACLLYTSKRKSPSFFSSICCLKASGSSSSFVTVNSRSFTFSSHSFRTHPLSSISTPSKMTVSYTHLDQVMCRNNVTLLCQTCKFIIESRMTRLIFLAASAPTWIISS